MVLVMRENVETWSERLRRVVDTVSSHVLGRREEVEVFLSALVAGGHVLVMGPPGTGKTLLAKAVAKALGASYARVQGNPDILPTDITGFFIHTLTGERRFIRGPVFTNILHVDDLNRIPTRAQSALIEAMAEYRVTVEGETFPLERPFHVVATLIPSGEEIDVYEIIRGLMDRFWVSLRADYLGREIEVEIASRADTLYLMELEGVEPVMTAEELRKLQDSLGSLVYIDKRVASYIVDLVSTIRGHQDVLYGPSHRTTVQLYRLSKAYALLQGRDYVVPDDVKKLALYALTYKFTTRPETGPREAEEVVREALEKTPVPKD